MTLRDETLPIFEEVRMLFDDLGFRQYDVSMRVVSWTGETVGEGDISIVDKPLTVSGKRVKVRKISTADIIASQGIYTDADMRIGAFTPTYRDVSYFEEADGPNKKEIFFKVTGPGMENGAWFKKISQEVDRNTSYNFIVRKTATFPPEPIV